jgi:hypothetical protein
VYVHARVEHGPVKKELVIMKETRKASADFKAVMAALEEMLKPYEKELVLSSSPSGEYSLSTRHVMPNKQALFFASYQPRKHYVSYYLMPVYVFPDLLEGISDGLRKRMQGKSCFNFKHVDAALFEELRALTRAGFERYREEGLLG